MYFCHLNVTDTRLLFIELQHNNLNRKCLSTFEIQQKTWGRSDQLIFLIFLQIFLLLIATIAWFAEQVHIFLYTPPQSEGKSSNIQIGQSILKLAWRHWFCKWISKLIFSINELNRKLLSDTTKRLMSSPKCRSVEVINNPARPGSNHREVNCINYR